MAKLTYEEYRALEQTRKPGEKYELFRHLPMEAKELHNQWTDSDVLDKLVEIYSDVVSRLTFDVMIGLVSLGDLPIFIEKEAKVDRRVALHCSIKVCRHFLKQCSQYIDYIGNVDAYIEDWKDELREE